MEGNQPEMTPAEKLYAEFLDEPGQDFESFRARHADCEEELRRIHEQYQGFQSRGFQFAHAFGAGNPGESGDAGRSSDLPPDFEDLLRRLRRHREVSSRYHLHGEVARGGMGAILRIHDDELDRDLAMKVILGQSPDSTGETPQVDSRLLARFLDEAQVTGQLDHPGVVPVHELGIDNDGRVYFTMRLVKGRDLKEVFSLIRDDSEDWNETRALGVILKACEAVAYAHSKGVIHRDLKPGNIMVGRFGEVYVMDWGLARVQGRVDTKDLRLRSETSSSAGSLRTLRREEAEATPDSPLVTMDGHVVGTPSYMSPEQAQGDLDQLGPRSDVYSMGAMLYELLAGNAPYVVSGARKTPHTVLAEVLNGPPRPLRQIRADVPVELEAICEKAMAREAPARYGSVVELADDLQAFLEGRVVRAYRTGALAELRKWVRRNRAVAMVGLTAFVAVVVLAGWASWSADQARRRTEEVLRLSGSQDYEDLIVEAEKLWPAGPDKVDAYKEWIATADELVSRIPALKATCEKLRRDAIPRTEEERQAQRKSHPDYPKLEPLLAKLEAAVATAGSEAGLAEAEGEIARLQVEHAALEARLDERREWTFPDEKESSRWWNNQLTRLISELESLSASGTGLLTEDGWSVDHGWSMPQRLAVAERFAEGGEFARRWEEALPAIEVVYPGLELSAQTDLVPIGADPASKLWEFWHVWSGTEPVRGGDGKLVMEESSGLVFVLLRGGKFWMGAQKEEPAGKNYDPQANSDEAPVHEVELSAFFLSKYEMTQGQWTRAAGRNPSYNQGGPLCAVDSVTWFDCRALLRTLDLRLPSEAQWEYGARGGTDTVWWTGSEAESLKSAGGVELVADVLPGPLAVASYVANGFGLHEVIGSVWEWCLDGYDGSFYGQSPALDPVSRPAGSASRVYRGGSFNDTAANARSAFRNLNTPAIAGVNLGVRPARVITE